MSLPRPSISGLEELLRPGPSSPWEEEAHGRVVSKAGPRLPQFRAVGSGSLGLPEGPGPSSPFHWLSGEGG